MMKGRTRGRERRGDSAPSFFTVVVALGLMAAGISSLSPGAAHAASYPAFADMSSPQAVLVADRILSWQMPHGGWGKDLPIATTAWTPGTPKSTLQAAGVELGTIDNGATTTEIRYLARVYEATGEERFRDGALRGIDFLLKAQYPTGGWPQVYPRRGNYSDEVTFNDDAMVRVMELLREVAEGVSPFGFVDADRRKASRIAFERGIEYILRAQIVVEGRLTAWCAQHDPWTYEPKTGRPYEHPSISGSESVGIVRLLLTLSDPDERVRRAILSALLWLEEARLPDGRWARFYEIGTNRPIFSGRDGVIRYNIDEIEAERRHGYAWYGTWPEQLLRRAWSDETIASLHASLPGFEVPIIVIASPPEGVSAGVRGDLAVEVAVESHAPETIRRVTVTIDGEPVYDERKASDPGRLVIDTTRLADGRRSLEVTVEYPGGQVTRRRPFVVQNGWERRIAMRAPEDHGWFGVIDYFGAVERSDGWTFLADRSAGADVPPFGVTYRLGWDGETDEYVVWEAEGLRRVELLVVSTGTGPQGLVLEAGWDDPATGERRWRALAYAAQVEREAEGRKLLRLIADVAWPAGGGGEPGAEGVPGESESVAGPVRWLRIAARAAQGGGPLEIGDLRLRGMYPSGRP